MLMNAETVDHPTDTVQRHLKWHCVRRTLEGRAGHWRRRCQRCDAEGYDRGTAIGRPRLLRFPLLQGLPFGH